MTVLGQPIDITPEMEQVFAETCKKVEASDMVCVLLTDEKALHSAKVALEVGFAMLLTKPILIIAPIGLRVPTPLNLISFGLTRYEAGNDEDFKRAVESTARHWQELSSAVDHFKGLMKAFGEMAQRERDGLREDRPDARPDAPDHLDEHVDDGRDKSTEPAGLA